MFWTPRLCRICGSVAPVTYPIFSSASKDVEIKFRKCFSIGLYIDDFKPKEICDECLSKLNSFSDFLDLCIESNNRFETILYETTKSETVQEEQWQTEMQVKLFPPDDGVIMKTDEMGKEVVVVEKNIYDLENYNNPNTVLRHSSEFYKNDEINLEEFQLYSQKKKNNWEGKAKPFVCSKCDKGFMRKLSLKAHMSSHTNIKPFRCEICNKAFPLRCNLTAHKKVHTDSFQCKSCLKTFAAPSKLERHMRIHTNDRPFKCEVVGCGRTFTDKRNLVGHRVTHSDDRSFMCDDCGKGYKTKSQLNDHKKAHTDISFPCDFCDKVFKWKANYLLHLKKHTDYPCAVCQARFKNHKLYLAHRKQCIFETD
ncbi:PREDICTED: gastrula zinc finger protein XlCGF8.2DB-like [Nicrophorus vespilloides]|uniref:Gastrula zinc finger protein XlCGF8.2DB-like n=1 Tax=Nicrophorus vespilloides TaxID=110193 RepID=A0ABM1MZA6_NICVS|nr:PREDICTED: gastrula zinc finger protein XlCGF8.2DB-like [Nicrophorus vespilloides]